MTETMKTYKEYIDERVKQDAIVNNLSDRLNSYPKGDYGLTEERIRLSEEYRTLTRDFNREFEKLRSINLEGMRKFKKEIQAAYMSKRIK